MLICHSIITVFSLKIWDEHYCVCREVGGREKNVTCEQREFFSLYRHHEHHTTKTCIYVIVRLLKGTCHMTTHAGNVKNNGE